MSCSCSQCWSRSSLEDPCKQFPEPIALFLPHTSCLSVSLTQHASISLLYLHTTTLRPSPAHHLLLVSPPYLKQPAVLVRAVSHSRCLGLQFSSPAPAPLLPCSQPECGTITSSERACSAWSTISILIESWEDRFHSVPKEEHKPGSTLIKTSVPKIFPFGI